jgi:hypothetical protein
MLAGMRGDVLYYRDKCLLLTDSEVQIREKMDVGMVKLFFSYSFNTLYCQIVCI